MQPTYLKTIFSSLMGFICFLFVVVTNHRFDLTIQNGMERNLKILNRHKLTETTTTTSGVSTLSSTLKTKATSGVGTFSSVEFMKAMTCQKNNHSDLIEKTIVIVPYRNRSHNLKLFLSPLHKHLMNQVWIWNISWAHFQLDINVIEDLKSIFIFKIF